MATLIRLKRKKSTSNSGIILASGEPYYNLIDKRLYIGNTNGENISSSSKKHIAEITPIEAGATTVKFQIGEDENNVYEKKITADEIEGTISNATDASNVTSTISGTAISALFNMSNNKPTSAKSASSVKNLSLDTSSGATIKLTWGENNEHSTQFTVNAGSISGVIDSAKNVTEQINGTRISDIFDTATVVKNATKLNTARTIRTNLESNSTASFDGTTDVTPGVTGTLSISNGGTGATTADGVLTNLGITATSTELNYVAGVSSNIQGQLDSKQSTITGSATTIASNTLTANRALITNGDGKVAISDVSSVELKYLDGVTSNVQTQLNAKAAADHTHKYAGSSSAGGSATSAVKLDSSAGSSTTPVYFSSGKPVVCTSLDLDTSGNSATATKLETGREITLSGDVTGSTTFDGSSAVTITTKVAALEWKSF